MRFSFLRFLLPLFLLFAQQEALLHELSHYGEAIERAQSPRKQVPETKSCEKCVVFAHIAGAVHSEAPQLTAPNLSYDRPQPPTLASIAADVPSPRSRGPPTSL
jgi:hypothetical protein